ncbi:MAG: hypothetical protein AAF702_44505 [Chloroflexota bacterium]
MANVIVKLDLTKSGEARKTLTKLSGLFSKFKSVMSDQRLQSVVPPGWRDAIGPASVAPGLLSMYMEYANALHTGAVKLSLISDFDYEEAKSAILEHAKCSRLKFQDALDEFVIGYILAEVNE